jgi:hypothetical protein
MMLDYPSQDRHDFVQAKFAKSKHFLLETCSITRLIQKKMNTAKIAQI